MINIIKRYCLLMLILFSSCGSNNDQENNSNHIYNTAPIKNINSIDLKLIKKIPMFVEDKYLMNTAGNFKVDKNGNLYALDALSNTIFKFDNNLNFVKKMGGRGDGPSELNYPSSFYINNEKMYVFERHKGIKVWDLKGKYLDYFLKKGEILDVQPLGENMALLKIKVIDRNNLEFSISVNEIKNFMPEINKITTLKFNREDNLFWPSNLAMDSENNFYYPVAYNKYIINKFDKKGNLLFSFGREYDHIPYSKELSKWKNDKYGNSPSYQKKLRNNMPTIVNVITVDDRDLLWVIVGETSRHLKINKTIDIFNTNGEFLHTFQTDINLVEMYINKNRLYAKNRTTDSKYEESFSVYEIIYNLDTKK